MASNKVLEQHIAVFGESGSGKTVMLSSFYGSEQESANVKSGTFNLIAESASQGTHLLKNYLGMKNSATLPAGNKFNATTYSFLLKMKGATETKAVGAKPFEALRLVWHDYPGEWFESDVSGPEEAQRRVDTFRALLSSHVALLLVDGQKLLENEGAEERYLKSLMSNFRNSLLLLKEDLLADGNPLTTFPRIWVVGLSKADLLPKVDVNRFRELIIEKVGDEIVALRDVLAGFVDSDDALSVGEDFVLVSSAKFSPGAIEVTQRIGIDLILPMAAVLPFERHLRWVKAEKISKKVAMSLLSNAELVATAIGAAGGFISMLMGKKSKLVGAIGMALSSLAPNLENAIQDAYEKLEATEAESATKAQNLALTLAGFNQALNDAEAKGVLLRSLQ